MGFCKQQANGHMRCCHAAGAWLLVTSMTCRWCSASASFGSSMGHRALSTPSCRPLLGIRPPTSSCASPTRWPPGSAAQQLGLWSAAASRCAFGWPKQSSVLRATRHAALERGGCTCVCALFGCGAVTCMCLDGRLCHSQQVPRRSLGLQMLQQRMCAGHAVPAELTCVCTLPAAKAPSGRAVPHGPSAALVDMPVTYPCMPHVSFT